MPAPTIPLSVFESPNGKVRLWYRTKVNAADQFERSFLAFAAAAPGKIRVGARDLGRFCLERFAVKLAVLKGTDWIETPFSWEVLEGLTDEYAEDGWPSIAAAEIWMKVVQPHDTAVDALKKTSLTASENSSSKDPAAVPDSPTST